MTTEYLPDALVLASGAVLRPRVYRLGRASLEFLGASILGTTFMQRAGFWFQGSGLFGLGFKIQVQRCLSLLYSQYQKDDQSMKQWLRLRAHKYTP